VSAARLAGLLFSTLLGPWAAAAQQPGPAPAPAPAAAGRDTVAESTTHAVEPETFFVGDTIMVLEDMEGLVWGDWYVNPEVGVAVERAIERRGELSGRTWLESAAPIRDLALEPRAKDVQALTFVDKGVALNFWEPDEVDYEFRFEGPWGLRASGRVSPGRDAEVTERVRIPLPISDPPSREGLDKKRRVGRVEVRYQPRGGRGIPRGRFTVYLYYLSPRLGYRIAGVGF
jgi:hypothetical protein